MANIDAFDGVIDGSGKAKQSGVHSASGKDRIKYLGYVLSFR